MNLLLKGITKASTVDRTQHIPVFGYAFDLRPKSFNFTQLKNIQAISEECPLHSFDLIFENESPFVINEILKKFEDGPAKPTLEFCGAVNFLDLDKFNLHYSWRYHEEVSLSKIKAAKNLTKLIFTHSTLEYYLDNGELFGFLQLFNDKDFSHLQFELLLDWDSFVIESVLDINGFDFISFELNSKVELSYQNPDEELVIAELMKHKINLMTQGIADGENTFI